MGALPEQVYYRSRDKGVQVFYADRGTVKYWNHTGLPKGHPRFLCGHYWYASDPVNGRAISGDIVGPFHTSSAAYRDAFLKLGLKLKANPTKPSMKTAMQYLRHPTGTRAPTWMRQ